MAHQKKKKSLLKRLIFLVATVAVVVYGTLAIIIFTFEKSGIIQKAAHVVMDEVQDLTGGLTMPPEYISIYQAAAEEYDIPWTLLAAVHRIETRFSTMSTLISPVGAEGHMQFMPCTFVGWNHPSCSGLGQGDIPEEDKTNPEVIAQYGGYGVDANGDGIADPFDIEDAIYSAAHYLSKSGAAEGDIKKALFNYNRSDRYVSDVYAFYEEFEEMRDQLEGLAAAEN